jgi:uncharacterized OB-fold protein
MKTGILPVPASDVAPFWRSTSGKLLVQRCNNCAETYHYPRPFCPFCSSTEVSWIETAGTGHVYSCSYVPNKGAGYVIAFVTLDEGPTLLTNITGIGAEQVTIGARVAVDFETRDSVEVPVFKVV